MNYRIHELLPAEAANAAATKTLDLDIVSPISKIVVQFKGTNNGGTPTAHPAKMIPKIEIVDGSNVLFGLSGVQTQALSIYNSGIVAGQGLDYQNDVMAIALFELDFGRHLWDPLLALDPTKFSNPQLKISHNLALGGCSPDAGELSVFAFVFDEKAVAPTGFLMSKELFNYTLVASATQHVDLATDYAYRTLMLQSMSLTLQPFSQFNKIKLSEDSDRRVVINNISTSNLIKLLNARPNFTEVLQGTLINGSVVFPVTASYGKRTAFSPVASAAPTAFINDSYGGSVSIAATEAETIQAIVSGMCPHGAVAIPFGDQAIPEDWYAVDKIGNLRLSILAGSGASGTCEIIAQQRRNY